MIRVEAWSRLRSLVPRMSIPLGWFWTICRVISPVIEVLPDLNIYFLLLFRTGFRVVGRRSVSSGIFRFLGRFSTSMASHSIIFSYVSYWLWVCYCRNQWRETLLSSFALVLIFVLLFFLRFDVLTSLHWTFWWFDQCKFGGSLEMGFRRLHRFPSLFSCMLDVKCSFFSAFLFFSVVPSRMVDRLSLF